MKTPSVASAEYTDEEKEAIRAQLREGNRVAREVALKRGAKVHPRVASLLALPLLFVLGACAARGPGSVVGGECKVFEAPRYAVKGAKQYDQDWIDSTIEGGVGACGWARPAPRPDELNAPAKRPVQKAPTKKKKPLWLQMLRWKKPAPAPAPQPEAAATPLTVLPAEPEAPAPRSAIDELLMTPAGQ